MNMAETERYKLILAYDGTAYSGMQRQADGVTTVQGEVENALKQLDWQQNSILAAGRTDAGVHASGQVLAFDLSWKHPAENLKNALNALMPKDISVQALQKVMPDFHPRYDATARRYQYRLYCAPQRNPLLERFTWRVWPEPDLEAMQSAASDLLGSHDFAAYGTPPKEGGTTVREVFMAFWQQTDGGLLFEVEANAFLYHMVRRMVRLLVDIGQGREPVHAVRNSLTGEHSGMIQGLAPPNGLSLVHVTYPDTALSGEDE